jgi:hypothetical protein
VFRAVIGGSSQGPSSPGGPDQMGDTQLRPSNRPWEAVVAGPDGLDEVIIIGDRRGAAPRVTSADPTDLAWADAVGGRVDRLRARLAAPAPA